MVSKSRKLLQRMKNSSAGWKRSDLDRLYLSFGFIIDPGSRHDIAKHPDFPALRATLTRHTDIDKVYIKQAIALIEELQELEKEEGNDNEPD